jgi:hypothetical protein
MSEDEEIDLMIDFFLPELTPEEQKEQLEAHRKGAEFIIKNGIKANCDTPNFND